MKRDGVPNILNPLDYYALEEALQLKEKFGIRVDVLTMGPGQAEEVLKYCIDKGADKGFLLNDRLLAGSDTLATAKALSTFLAKNKYQLIFCGQETIDGSTGQVGPSIAEQLNIPQVTFVQQIIKIENGGIFVKKEVDLGYQVIEIKPPCLLSFIKSEKEIKEPEKAKEKYDLTRLGLKDLNIEPSDVGLEGSPTQVVKISVPEDRLTTFFKVDNRLNARDKIKFILNGGIDEKSNKITLHGCSQNVMETISRNIFPGSET